MTEATDKQMSKNTLTQTTMTQTIHTHQIGGQTEVDILMVNEVVGVMESRGIPMIGLSGTIQNPKTTVSQEQTRT